MTICIAGIHDKQPSRVIIACFDRRLTTMGGIHSSDGTAWKMKTVRKNWWALLSGKTSDLTAMGYAFEEGLKDAVPEIFIDFARYCVGIYKVERRKLVETEVLSDYDVNSYEEYLSLKASDRDFYDAIEAKVKDFDQGLNVLMCGFERDSIPHIFVISGPGNLAFCDAQGYGVIGTGAWAAQFSLDRQPYDKWKRLGECIFAVLAAKFTAEAAEGVGPDSVLFVLDPEWNKLQALLKEPALAGYKEKWKALPRIPDGIVDDLENSLNIHDMVTRMRSSHAEAYTMPSDSETSEDQQ